MDESRTRSVHGDDERCQNLESRFYWCQPLSFNLRWIQGPRLSFFGSHRAGPEQQSAGRAAKIGNRSAPAKTGGKSPHGAAAKGESKIADNFQETEDSLFGPNRPREVRPIVSFRPHGEQHRHRRYVRFIFSALGLALFHRRGCGWLFANLSRSALAERHRSDVLHGGWGSAADHCVARSRSGERWLHVLRPPSLRAIRA